MCSYQKSKNFIFLLLNVNMLLIYTCNYVHLLGLFIVSGILKLISLGPLYLLCCSCAIHVGLLAPAYPTRANEPRWSVKMGRVAPSLLRAVMADKMYFSPES